jgi:uncharacterized protein
LKLYTTDGEDIILSVRVQLRASKSQIAGVHDDVFKVRISSPPVDGAANAELIKLLAKYFGVAKTDVRIEAGLASRTKRIRLGGLPEAVAVEKLK